MEQTSFSHLLDPETIWSVCKREPTGTCSRTQHTAGILCGHLTLTPDPGRGVMGPASLDTAQEMNSLAEVPRLQPEGEWEGPLHTQRVFLGGRLACCSVGRMEHLSLISVSSGLISCLPFSSPKPRV